MVRVGPRGYHSSVTSLISLWSRASHIIASDEDLGDAMNDVITEILTKSLHHIMAGKTILNQEDNLKKNTVVAPWLVDISQKLLLVKISHVTNTKGKCCWSLDQL